MHVPESELIGSPEVWAAGVSGLVLILTTILSAVWASNRGTRQTVSSQGELAAMVNELQREMQLTVLPSLIDLKGFMDGYQGTPWYNREAIDQFIERVGGIEAAVAGLERDIAAVHRALRQHVDWEEQSKYEHLEEALIELHDRIDARRA